MKAILLRVGIDTGYGRNALSPIFKDGTFEYIPLGPEDNDSEENRTYGNVRIKNKLGRSFGNNFFADFLPSKLEWKKNWKKYSKDTKISKIHYDPEFDTFTYGDYISKKKNLSKLDKGDLLVFYAGLKPYKNNIYETALYIIGHFLIKEKFDFNKLSKSDIKKCFKLYFNNAHSKRKRDTKDLVIFVGEEEHSKILNKAILISKTKLDKKGHRYLAVSDKMEKLLGISGSIQRSVTPRIIYNKRFINNLKKILNLNQ